MSRASSTTSAPLVDDVLAWAIRGKTRSGDAGDAGETSPPRLGAALHHAVFPGGARVRPRLCVAVGVACGLAPDDPALIHLAAAVELIHCASLVHDDLPCFDDAEVRRGRPTVHVAFDEATAVLVGDGLLTLGFDVAARATELRPLLGTRALRTLLAATGAHGGLVAGQAWETEPAVDVARYHAAKTAALFRAAAAMGAIAAGAETAPFERLGTTLGMTYQLADDVGDRTGTQEQLGKPAGRDAALRRPSAASGSLDEARRRLWAALSALPREVPPCPGEAALREEVARIARAIGARCFGDGSVPRTASAPAAG